MTVHPDEPLIVVDDDWDFDEPTDDEPGVRRPRRRALVGLLAVAGFLLASVIVTTFDESGSDPSRPDTSGLAAVEPGSLPAELTQAWSIRFAGSGNTVATSLTVDDDLAVVVVADGSRDRSLVAGVDTSTGEQLWRRSYPYSPAEMDPLLVEDGVVVLEQNDRLSSNRLIGISAADGSDVWERRMRDQSFSGVLAGTSLLVNIDDDESTATTFHSPATGEPVGSVDGDVSTTDLDGTWYFTTDSTLEQVDLSEGWTEPAGTAQIRDAGGQQIVPVDGSLITIDGTGRLAEVGSEGNLTMLRADDVPPIDAMWPSGGRTFVGVGDGKVVGVELLREAAVLRWQRDGAVRQFGLTGGGLLLVVGDPETDAERLVVDATTGDELTSFRTGATGGGAVQFTSDGFVASPNGSDHEAFDSVGSRLWRLEDAGQLAVGDGLVVSLANTPSGFRLTGYHG